MMPAMPSVVSTVRPKLPTRTAFRVSSSAAGTGSAPMRVICSAMSCTASSAVSFLVCVRAATVPGRRRADRPLEAP